MSHVPKGSLPAGLSPSRPPLLPPEGTRDLLPEETAAHADLGGALLRSFASRGFQRVITPIFERAEVIERGLSEVDDRGLMRFVDPMSGAVALLRPDITPQVARLIATRLRGRPAPYRLAYMGSLIRQTLGRARLSRQIVQAGVELVGIASIDGDVEVIALAAESLRGLGLRSMRIELGLPSLPRRALHALPEALRAAAASALSQKDRAELARLFSEAEIPEELGAPLLGSIELYGDLSVVEEAREVFRGEEAARALADLDLLLGELRARGLEGSLSIDLGELRGESYYSGVSFKIFAEGPGEPLGGGGRYDELLGRFGAPAPATGFALDLGNVAWALRAQGAPAPRLGRPSRVAVAGIPGPLRARIARALRDRGAEASELPPSRAEVLRSYLLAWHQDLGILIDGERLEGLCAEGDVISASAQVGDCEAEEALIDWALSKGGKGPRGDVR